MARFDLGGGASGAIGGANAGAVAAVLAGDDYLKNNANDTMDGELSMNTHKITDVVDPVANQGNTINPGGFRNVDDDSMIAGSGSLINQKNRVRAKLVCLVANDLNTAFKY